VDFVEALGLTSTWTPSGVLKGWETPGVAEEMADGVVESPTVGWRGAEGEGGAETEALLSLLYDRS
jgi:hypothetical protein